MPAPATVDGPYRGARSADGVRSRPLLRLRPGRIGRPVRYRVEPMVDQRHAHDCDRCDRRGDVHAEELGDTRRRLAVREADAAANHATPAQRARATSAEPVALPEHSAVRHETPTVAWIGLVLHLVCIGGVAGISAASAGLSFHSGPARGTASCAHACGSLPAGCGCPVIREGGSSHAGRRCAAGSARPQRAVGRSGRPRDQDRGSELDPPALWHRSRTTSAADLGAAAGVAHARSA